MNVQRSVLIPFVLACICSCATSTPGPALLKLDARPAGLLVFARIQPAAGWQKQPDRVERGVFNYLAPDNYSRFWFGAQPVVFGETDCGKYALETTHDVAYTFEKRLRKFERTEGRSTDTQVITEQVEPNATEPGSVAFRLRVVDLKQNAPDRIVLGRTLCRPNGLAVASCTLSSKHLDLFSPACTAMLASLDISDHAGPDETRLVYDADTVSVGMVRSW